MIQSFLTLDSMDRTLKCVQSMEILFFNFTQFVILENVSVLDLALSGVKGLNYYKAQNWFLEGHFRHDTSVVSN